MHRLPDRLRHFLHRRDLQPRRQHAIAHRLVRIAVAAAVEQRGFDEARADRAHLDPVGGPFRVEAFGDPAHRELGRAVDAHAGAADDPRRAGDVDEARSRCRRLEVGIGRLRAPQHAFQIYVETALDLVRAQFGERPARADPGVVDHHVDPAARGGGEGGQCGVPGLAVAHVEPVGVFEPAADQAERVLHALFVDVADADEPAALAEMAGGGAPDAGRAAGDEDAAPLIRHETSLRLRFATGLVRSAALVSTPRRAQSPIASARPFTCSAPSTTCVVDGFRTSPSGSARPPRHSDRKFSAIPKKARLLAGLAKPWPSSG